RRGAGGGGSGGGAERAGGRLRAGAAAARRGRRRLGRRRGAGGRAARRAARAGGGETGGAYEKVIVEAQTTHVYDEATIVEQVVENNVKEVNEIGDDDQAEGSQPVREPRGEVDEGEHIPGLVERMRREDTEGDVRGDEDSDNDDDRPVQVPSQWNNYDHSQLLVNEGETVPWEYGENEVSVGAIYHSKIELKEAVQRWAAKSLKKEFGVVKSSPQVYHVKCIRDDCPFRVHAYMEKYDTFWSVSRIEHHTCILEELEVQHRNLTADFVAQHMYSKILRQSLRGETKALEMRWGTYESSYHNLPRVLHTLCRRNPGSYFEIKHYNLHEDPTKRVLRRAFFVLAACINAFRCCRPVLCIDGTFLTREDMAPAQPRRIATELPGRHPVHKE
ncbi:hypothetical protein U9M48_036769, partial [Paspalum notatum var. saurae]